MSISFSDRLCDSLVGSFHNQMKSLFSPLPATGKAVEVIKRIAAAIFFPVAYPVLGVLSLIGCAIDAARFKSTGNQENYFVRFINVQKKDAKFADLKQAIDEDKADLGKGYHKGACAYTPNSTQRLAVDVRFGQALGVEFPFGLIIDPKVKVNYWSLQDMDRTGNRDQHEAALKTGQKKYIPQGFNAGTQDISWKTVHFTNADAFFKKVECVGKAVLAGMNHYTTPGGKQKPVDILTGHNEGAITYNPEKDVRGFLIRPEDKELAIEFKGKYVDEKGNHVFKNVFLAYQDANGKIVKI